MKESPLSILALGDSYTIGEGVEEEYSWPYLLAKVLKDEGFQTQPPVVIAKTGWTTGELIQAIEHATIGSAFSMVFLLIGVNNQYRGYPVEEYRKEFKALLNTAIHFCTGGEKQLYVISIPDWGNTPYAEGRDRRKISEEIDVFNLVNREEADSVGCNYISITDITREAPLHPSMLTSDQLHPSGNMYALWVKRILEKIALY